MDTFRALAPPEGMKFTPLFAVPIKDEDQRFARLEQSVQALRNDFDTVTPTLVRLAAIEQDIRGLVAQLRALDNAEPIAEADPVTNVSQTELAPPPVSPVSSPPSPAPSQQPSSVKALTTPNTLPGKDITGGTEAAAAKAAVAGQPVPSLPVTPEAAPKGPKPPEGAASPLSLVPPAKPVVPAPAPQPQPAPKTAAVMDTKAAPAMDLTPLMSTPAAPPSKLPTTPKAEAPKTEVAPPKTAEPKVAPKTEAKAGQKTAPSSQPPAPPPPPAAVKAKDAPVPQAEAVAPASPQVAAPSTPAPKVVMGDIAGDVTALRIGDHIDKTRLVLDVTVAGSYKARLENDGRRLVIELPHHAWKTGASWSNPSAALVTSYRYADGALVFDMRAPAVIRTQTALPGDSGEGPRIMIELFSSQVHVE